MFKFFLFSWDNIGESKGKFLLVTQLALMSIAVKRHQHFSVLCIQWKYYAVTYSNNVAISWINQSVLTKKQKQLSNKVNLQWLQSSCSHVHWATTTIPPFNWTNITGSITLTAAITDTPNDLHRLGIRDRRKTNKCSTALNLGYYTYCWVTTIPFQGQHSLCSSHGRSFFTEFSTM